jgi:hypothetical protein
MQRIMTEVGEKLSEVKVNSSEVDTKAVVNYDELIETKLKDEFLKVKNWTVEDDKQSIIAFLLNVPLLTSVRGGQLLTEQEVTTKIENSIRNSGDSLIIDNKQYTMSLVEIICTNTDTIEMIFSIRVVYAA